MERQNFRPILFAALALAGLSGCVKMPDEESGKGPAPAANSFDFATTKACPVEVNYRQNGYSFLVEIYDRMPVEQITCSEISVKGDDKLVYTSEAKIAGLEPIFRAITDKDGRFSDVMDIPTGLKKVYLYTEYMGLPSVVVAEVTQGGIRFDLDELSAAAKSKALSTRSDARQYPAGMLVLGGWNDAGVPDYLMPERAVHPSGLMNDINAAIPYVPTTVDSPLWKYLDKSGSRTNISLKQATPVTLVFADENASMQNVIGYYHYPTGNAPASADQVKTIIALPNVSYPSVSEANYGAMSSGDQVQLKYWNSDKGMFEEEFPANTTIGFVVLSNSFNPKQNASIKVFNAFYSNNEFNTTETAGYRQHCIAMNDTKRGLVVYGFEDVPRKNNFTDKYPGGNFRDAFFYIKTTVAGAIDPDGMAVLPPASTDTPPEAANVVEYKGSLSFEDLWPYEGDYDMNDMVIDYVCTQYRNTRNQVIRTVDQFTARHNGGQVASGFGFQMNIGRDQIKNVLIDPAPASSSVFKADAKGLETNQSKATVMLFDDIRTSVGKTFTVTTEFQYAQNAANLLPPYNAFAVIHTDLGRGKEVHLPNQKPTDLADASLFGMGDDRSNAEQNIYYVAKDGKFPFAIKIPGVFFEFPSEMVRIDKQYPMFGKWVESNGTDYENWYESGISIGNAGKTE